MNHEVWNMEAAARWGNNLKMMRANERTTRRWCRIYGAASVFYSVLVLVSAWRGNYFTELAQLLACWFMYRWYLRNRKIEMFWRSCAHHGERMLHETLERAQWHQQQLALLLSGGRQAFRDRRLGALFTFELGECDKDED